MKKLVSLLLTGALSFGLLAGCGGGNSGSANTPAGNSETPSGNSETPAVENTASLEGTTIKVGATPAPHAEILEVAKGILAEQGITLEIVEFNDYIQPNLAVESGELDANYFQHITYMNEFNVSDGTHLVSAAEIHYEPFGLYAGKTAGITATKADIADNPRNLDIVELEASQLPVRLGDVDMAVINGNYAIDAGLKVSDALAVESADGEAAQAYVNVLAVKEGRENDPAIQALVEALKSDEVKTFMDETYEGAVVPMF